MVYQSLAAARRHPTATFGTAGGLFALAFFLAVSTRELLSGTYDPSFGEVLVVVGGFAGGALVSRILWRRLRGGDSPRRGAAVGALVGLLALPVPMYLLVFGGLAFAGLSFDPTAGLPSATRAVEYAALLVGTPLVLGAWGLVLTRGGTVIVGAVVGYLLARR